MIKNIFMESIPNIWPMIVIILVIVSSCRIAYIVTRHKKFQLHKELIYLIGIIYILCLFYVVTFQDSNFGESNYIPFKEIFRYSIGSKKFIKNILGNIMLFIPYGFLSSYFLKNKKVSVTMILSLIVSTTIEIVQYYIGRVFDIDDIILNVLGGVIGGLLFVGIDAIGSKVKILKNDTIIDILVILMLVLLILYSFNINIFGMIWG